MGVQNAVQRMHLASLPPRTLDRQYIQAALDAVARIRGANSDWARQSAAALAVTLFAWVGFWCLAVPVLIGAAGAASAAKG